MMEIDVFIQINPTISTFENTRYSPELQSTIHL